MATENDDSSDCCYICLEPGGSRVCKCPRMVHPDCHTRWRLEAAGLSKNHEHRRCRFCFTAFPALKPPDGVAASFVTTVNMPNGIERPRFSLGDGPDAVAAWIRGAMTMEADVVTMHVTNPFTGYDLVVKGLENIDVVLYCIAMNKAKKASAAMQQQQLQPPATPRSKTPPLPLRFARWLACRLRRR